MVHKESIGRVVGDDGKTYFPEANDNGNGSFYFSFKTNPSDENETPITSNDIVIPYIVPYKDDIEKKIKFRLELIESPINVELPEISFNDIRGLQGENGALSIEFIDISTFNPNEKDENDEYIYSKDVIYIDPSDAEGLQDSIDAYVIYEENGERQTVKINSVINLSNYYTKTQVDAELLSLENYINRELTNVISDQQAINSILTDGITITESDYTPNDNVVNVISDASVEDIQNMITQSLLPYLTENDVDFDNSTGTINIKY